MAPRGAGGVEEGAKVRARERAAITVAPASFDHSVAVLVADVARVLVAQQIVCSDLAIVSQCAELSDAQRAELADVAADLGVLVLMQRELSGRLDRWVAARDAGGGA